ncbi:MAG TPA: FAD-dependent oxidoreductase [Cyanobacteria bacterium UBA8530]|nr:FAD-dependent oxidoreductase [Cyanobacteria bacterium UBA8530]
MKKTAEVVVIGGGVSGAAIAYNLAKRGCKDVVVLEKEYLSSGATGRCGAGVRQQWGTEMNLRLSMGSMRMFERMNEELEYRGDIELTQTGYLLVAYNERQWEQFGKNVELQHQFGLDVRKLKPREAREVVPCLNIDGLVGATYCPTDGFCNPFHVTQAYAEAAERLGVEIETFTTVTGIERNNGGISGVVTDKGKISAPIVVDAAGGWSQEIAMMAGLELPVYSERHQVMITEPVDPLFAPMVMSFQHGFYTQQTPHGSIIIGMGEKDLPHDTDVRASWQFLHKMSKLITWVLPPLEKAKVVRQWAGMYNMTPDKTPILGAHPDLEGFHMALGYSGHGFMIAPMVGVLLAESILGLPASLPMDKLDVGRFQRGELFVEPSVV